MPDVVIVGAGQAGAHTAMFLRQQKFAGSVLLLGEEPDLPYERPALSKEYLAGEKTFDKLILRADTFWAEKKIDVRLGARVTEVDAAGHRVRSGDDEWIEYKHLVWATGGTPKKLAGFERAHTIRHRADVDRLMARLPSVNTVAIIGGGYIGLEAAAVLSKFGKKVTVFEAQDRVLARVAGEPLSRFFEAEHRAKGVDIELKSAIDSEPVADLVIVGIGIDAAVDVLERAGATCTQGVVVDLQCKTSLPDVFAVGDCAAHPNVHAHGKTVRVESIQNANDQAMVVAKTIAGVPAQYDTIPWFWSNQYDLRLQTVGLFEGHDEVVVRGDPATRVFSVVYLKEGRILALDCINNTKDYMQGKALIQAKRSVDREKLATPTVLLKEL